jgi:hypothetical protein
MFLAALHALYVCLNYRYDSKYMYVPVIRKQIAFLIFLLMNDAGCLFGDDDDPGLRSEKHGRKVPK